MIQLQNIYFSYGKDRFIFENRSFEFQNGNVYMLVGENGSGKTTLLKILLGFLKPSEGEVSGISSYTIGYLPDYNGIYDNLSVEENMRFRTGIYKINYKDVEARADELLKKYGLYQDRNKLVKELSLGMQKKTALICTVLPSPTLLIMDEPTGGLDSDARRELTAMTRDMITDNSIVISTSHDEAFIKSLNGIVVPLGEQS